jgi:hypothetical protein
MYDFVDTPGRHANRFSQRILAYVKRLQEFFQQNFTG